MTIACEALTEQNEALKEDNKKLLANLNNLEERVLVDQA